MRAACRFRLVVASVALLSAACGGGERGGELRARKVVLQREVAGLRERAATLERGEPLLPAGDVVVAIDDSLVRDLIAAQLPFEAEVDRFRIALTQAEVRFRGSPVVRLRGSLAVKKRPNLSGEVGVLGALENIEIDSATGTLHASVGVDHLEIQKAAGLDSFLSGSTLDELARTIRLQLKGKLPAIQIPVKVQRGIDLPAVTDGPVRIHGASMSLQVGVSRVFAGQGQLWVGLSMRSGDFVKTKDAPPTPSAPDADAKPGAAGKVAR